MFTLASKPATRQNPKVRGRTPAWNCRQVHAAHGAQRHRFSPILTGIQRHGYNLGPTPSKGSLVDKSTNPRHISVNKSGWRVNSGKCPSLGGGNSSGGRQCADFSAVFFSQRLNQLFDGDDFVYSVGIGPRKSKSSVEVPFLGVAQCQSNAIWHIPEIAASQALPGAFESLFDA